MKALWISNFITYLSVGIFGVLSILGKMIFVYIFMSYGITLAVLFKQVDMAL